MPEYSPAGQARRADSEPPRPDLDSYADDVRSAEMIIANNGW